MFYSNLDSNLTDADRKRIEREERNAERVRERYKRAERAEREQGVEAPDAIHWFQEEGQHSSDPRLDNDPAYIYANYTSLPVKERITMPDGTDVASLSPAALLLVKEGKFCGRCEEKQPEDHVEKRERFERMVKYGLSLVAMNRHENCVTCGSKLGLHGTYEPPNLNEDAERKAVEQAMRNTVKAPDAIDPDILLEDM